VEPTCSTPSRLLGFRVGTLSNPEFACAPIVKPGSSFLTIEEGEDVTLICHVDADPAADIYWTFNGRKVEENVFKFSTKQLYEGRIMFKFIWKLKIISMYFQVTIFLISFLVTRHVALFIENIPSLLFYLFLH